MLGNMLNDSGQKQTKLVLIGDGDDTFGFSPNFPTQMAKLRNIRIYTIGVGNKGIVPFGKDYFGTPNLVENTFSDSLFRWSSAITGGQYFWAKDAAAITRALEDILK
jgi:Ca-activated chloride channel family protein